MFPERTIKTFYDRANARDDDGCWIWSGSTYRQGYGRMRLNKTKEILATHVSLIIDGRPRPPKPNDNALHGDCSNPACVNPRHLRWGNPKENCADRIRLGRSKICRGEARKNAKLTEEQAKDIFLSHGPFAEAAKRHGVSAALAYNIRRGKAWPHVKKMFS